MSTDRPVRPETGTVRTDGALFGSWMENALGSAGPSEVEVRVPAPRETPADPVPAPLRAPFSRIVRPRPPSLVLPPIPRSPLPSA